MGGTHLPNRVVSRIEADQVLCEFKTALRAFSSLGDSSKVVHGIAIWNNSALGSRHILPLKRPYSHSLLYMIGHSGVKSGSCCGIGARSDQSWRVAYGRLGAGAVIAEKTSAACDINHRVQAVS